MNNIIKQIITQILEKEYEKRTGKLDLSGSKITNNDFENIAYRIGKMTWLTKLELKGTNITNLDFLKPLKKLIKSSHKCLKRV